MISKKAYRTAFGFAWSAYFLRVRLALRKGWTNVGLTNCGSVHMDEHNQPATQTETADDVAACGKHDTFVKTRQGKANTFSHSCARHVTSPQQCHATHASVIPLAVMPPTTPQTHVVDELLGRTRLGEHFRSG